MNRVRLYLEDGYFIEGDSFGAPLTGAHALGELVFNTSMTGYQEILSDPSYCDQIIVMTYPLIGNYGVNKDDFEAMIPALKGFVVKEACSTPSNFRSEYSLDALLREFKVPGLCGVDTRALTKRIRQKGAQKALLAPATMSEAEVKKIMAQTLPQDQIARVSTPTAVHYPGEGPRVVLIDYGFKKNILRSLLKRGLDVVVVPWNTTAQGIHKFRPAGIMLSNGPGDPKSVPETLPVIRELQEKYPMMCICMGHQLFALANGADTEKMKFGHRGANHPVINLFSDRTYLTSQNHGYAVTTTSLNKTDLELTEINLNDKTVEGLRHKRYPTFSVQYHPEAFPGPEDTNYLFDVFVNQLQ